MSPAQLTSVSFSRYSLKARQLAVDALHLLQQLPLAFTPFLLKEIIDSDFKFPAELNELQSQLAYLDGLSEAQRRLEMAAFSTLALNPSLESFDWVNSPAQFLEQLSAHLWATHQMDTFRAASEAYVRNFRAGLRHRPLPVPRAALVVLGEGVRQNSGYPLFVKLKRQGTLFTRVEPHNGLSVLHASLEERARIYPGAYFHWCLDGGMAPALNGFATVSYQQIEPVRSALAAKMLDAYRGGHFDPEMLRTTLARTTYQSLGIKPSGDALLDRFSLSLLTEGSGTQIYSTTFVQWASREALRRAQPITLYAHYAPRQRERSMDELLGGDGNPKLPETDPTGSLIDADNGAYYTWLNQQRLPESDRSGFLVWFEDHREAVIVSPAHKPGAVDNSPAQLDRLAREVLLVPQNSTN